MIVLSPRCCCRRRCRRSPAVVVADDVVVVVFVCIAQKVRGAWRPRLMRPRFKGENRDRERPLVPEHDRCVARSAMHTKAANQSTECECSSCASSVSRRQCCGVCACAVFFLVHIHMVSEWWRTRGCFCCCCCCLLWLFWRWVGAREERAPVAICACMWRYKHTLIIEEDVWVTMHPPLQWCNCVGFATSQLHTAR